jgi:hypothetical protein
VVVVTPYVFGAKVGLMNGTGRSRVIPDEERVTIVAKEGQP